MLQKQKFSFSFLEKINTNTYNYLQTKRTQNTDIKVKRMHASEDSVSINEAKTTVL